MKTRVLDSWPILEWLNGREPAAALVTAMLAAAEAGKARLLMSAINAGEVYYFLRKQRQHAAAENWRRASGTMPVSMDVPAVHDIWAAAELKGKFTISYADAFAAELAQRFACPLVTGDPEFHVVEGVDLEWMGT